MQSIIEQKLGLELGCINDQVTLNNIYVYAEFSHQSHGEALDCGATRFGPEVRDKPLQRLIEHVKFLMNEAYLRHRTAYAELGANRKWSLKPDCLNKITRLLTPEFSLYTRMPLDPLEFRELYEAIEAHAQTLALPNLHFFFSSVALSCDEAHIFNMSFYVESGLKPVIHLFAKSIISGVDNLVYPQDTYRHFPITYEDRVALAFADGYSLPISSEKVFIITTAGAAKYWQFIDICIELTVALSCRVFEYRLSSGFDGYFLPNQADHLLSSNELGFYATDQSPIPAGTQTHIDPRHSRFLTVLADAPQKTVSTKFGAPVVIAYDVEKNLQRMSGSFRFYLDAYNREVSRLRHMEAFSREMTPAIIEQNSFIMLKNNIDRWHDLLLSRIVKNHAVKRFRHLKYMHYFARGGQYPDDIDHILISQIDLMKADRRDLIKLQFKGVCGSLDCANLAELISIQEKLISRYDRKVQRCRDAIIRVEESQKTLQKISTVAALYIFITEHLSLLNGVVLKFGQKKRHDLLSAVLAFQEDFSMRPFAKQHISIRSEGAAGEAGATSLGYGSG